MHPVAPFLVFLVASGNAILKYIKNGLHDKFHALVVLKYEEYWNKTWQLYQKYGHK